MLQLSCADVHSMEDAVRVIIETVGEDPSREGLLDTPSRVAKSMDFMTKGYTQDPRG